MGCEGRACHGCQRRPRANEEKPRLRACEPVLPANVPSPSRKDAMLPNESTNVMSCHHAMLALTEAKSRPVVWTSNSFPSVRRCLVLPWSHSAKMHLSRLPAVPSWLRLGPRPRPQQRAQLQPRLPRKAGRWILGICYASCTLQASIMVWHWISGFGAMLDVYLVGSPALVMLLRRSLHLYQAGVMAMVWQS
ncbi:hypothetical protein P171DRAFT_179970 [Karstenula rhodostoma CBS 690.94]|uniref:Uncharacterized protein n=1 Tax=Karstenula rhodostoma CBS 690.94 TaxID=1392251 RepID=A0A9P4U488_9PLEO|nr:hypothetical protein P171DRAFT_179970 [Karstenula rhodostoma CBS 690.94]